MSWFEDWFNTPYYHILYRDRDFSEAETFITHLTSEIHLPSGAKIIDLACGKGRHSVFLNKLGYSVLGVDLSEQSIVHNKKFENESLAFKVHDMRKPLYPEVAPEKVDAVFNLFTSFGYFDDAQEDEAVFRSVFDALKQDGVFILDFLNAQHVKDTLFTEQTLLRGDLLFTIKKRIEGQHVIKDIFFEDQGKAHHYYEKVKLHSKEEIKLLAENCGFNVQKIWGNYHLEPLEDHSPRCIFYLTKKEHAI